MDSRQGEERGRGRGGPWARHVAVQGLPELSGTPRTPGTPEHPSCHVVHLLVTQNVGQGPLMASPVWGSVSSPGPVSSHLEKPIRRVICSAPPALWYAQLIPLGFRLAHGA